MGTYKNRFVSLSGVTQLSLLEGNLDRLAKFWTDRRDENGQIFTHDSGGHAYSYRGPLHIAWLICTCGGKDGLMKRTLLGCALALGVAGVLYAADPKGIADTAVLVELGFVDKTDENTPKGVSGAGNFLVITDETIETLKKLQKEGKGVNVGDSGALKIVKVKK